MTDELQSLIEMLRSRRSKDAAKAVRVLRERSWLYDGTLKGVALVRSDLYRINMNRVDLHDANLRDAIIFMANAKFVNLRDADLTRAYLYRVSLAGADLRNAKLTEITLTEVNLTGANLMGADFRDAKLDNVDLRGANLTGTDLRGSDLTKCKLDFDQLEKARADKVQVYVEPPAEDSISDLASLLITSPSITVLIDNHTFDLKDLLKRTSDVYFSSYYPQYATAKSRHKFLSYAYIPNALREVSLDALSLGRKNNNAIQLSSMTTETVAVRHETELTIVPECKQLEFSPPQIKKVWNSDWVNFIFNFRPSEELVGTTVEIHVSIQVEGIEIASIPDCTVQITELEPMPLEATQISDLVESDRNVTRPEDLRTKFEIASEKARENRLAQAKKRAESYTGRTAAPYQKIFVSYSRKDTKVVRAYRAAQIAVGHDVFIDTESIRSGEDWEARLAQEIDQADIFQLFWSENSASSPNVRDEWEYALFYRCPDTRCVTFIRPVYWSRDGLKPSPPAELSHLNFRYAPLDES